MSQTNPSLPESALPDAAPVSVLNRVGARVRAPLETAAFWAAVVLPVVYLPLLATGLEGQTMVAFVGLLALNALSLVLGHSHRRDDDSH